MAEKESVNWQMAQDLYVNMMTWTNEAKEALIYQDHQRCYKTLRVIFSVMSGVFKEIVFERYEILKNKFVEVENNLQDYQGRLIEPQNGLSLPPKLRLKRESDSLNRIEKSLFELFDLEYDTLNLVGALVPKIKKENPGRAALEVRY